LAFLRDFRHALSVLKNQGLVEDVDARSAYPTWKRGGKKLSTLVSHYDAIVEGKATAVEVPDKVLRKYRAAGRETANGRVIEPHGLDETAYYDPKSEAIIIKHKSGIERIQIPIPFHNLEQWANDVKRNRKQINALKSGKEAFGFRYFGNNGSEFFGDIGLFIDFIRKYSSFEHGIEHVRSGANVYKNIEILRMDRHAMDEWVTPSERHHQRTKEYARKIQKRFRQRLKKKSKRIQDEYRESAMLRMRSYRKRMTKKERADYNEKGRKRWRKNNVGKRRRRK
jgi:hypothetical protein